MDLKISGKVVIVTGAAVGIGYEASGMLAREGAKVVMADINQDQLEQAADALKQDGLDVLPVPVNVADEQSVNSMVDKTVEHYGRLDILVNNAGIGLFKTMEEESLEEWQRVIDVNLTGVHLCARAAFRQMKQQNSGRIISIGSLGGQIGGMKVTPGYVAAKAGVMGLTKSYARNGAKYGITANSVSPGPVETDMAKGIYSPDITLMGRLAEAEDIAKVVVFLASTLADYMTGATVDVNGGILLR